MLILTKLFSLSKMQNFMFLQLLHLQKKIRKYQSFLSNNVKDQFIGIYKTRVKIKILQMSIDIFLNQTLQKCLFSKLFVLIYLNQDDNAKRYKAKKYYVPKGIIRNYNVIIDGTNFYDQPIDSDKKRYKEIRKLITKKGADYVTDVCQTMISKKTTID